MRRFLLILLAILALLVGLYAIVGYLVVPRVAKGQVESLLADRLGVAAEIETLSFDPFRLMLSARGFRMGDSGFRELDIDLDVAPFLRRAVVVDEIRLVGAVVELRISEAGQLRLAGIDLGSEAEPQAEPDAAPPASEPVLAALDVRRLAIEDGRFRLVDQSRSPALERELGPIDLKVEGLGLTELLDPSAPGGAPAEARLSVALDGGASLLLEGQLRAEPLELDLDFTLAALALAGLQPWVEPVARVELREGVLEASGHVRYADALEATGSLAMAGLEIGEPDVKPALVAWRSLDVTGIDVTGPPWKLVLGSVALAEPRVRLVQGPRGSNLAGAFSSESPVESAPDATGESQPIELEVGPVALADGSFAFEDRTVEPAYRVALESLRASIDRLSTSGGRTRLDVSAKLDGYAAVEVKGSLEPLDFRAFTDLTASARGLELSSFSPYSGRYVGNEIEAGQGSVDAHVRIEGHRVTAENTVVLEDLNFGKRVESPDATALPVPAAAALLANSDGEIRVDLPVRGDLDDPSFSYAGTLLNTVRTLITRVVGSPFTIVGGMVAYGGKLFPPEELGVVAFAPGSAELDENESLKLGAVAEAMQGRPTLEVDLSGGADPALDGDVDHRVLARRRAAAVQEGLESAGVPESRIHIGEIQLGDGLTRTRLEVR